MWPLVVLSLLGFILFIERTLYLHKNHIRTDPFLSGVKNLLSKRRLVEALTVCEETPGPVVNVIKAALVNHDKDAEQIRSAVQAAALIQIPNLERRIGSIGAIARISPLLGLLGTVVGMIQTFYELQVHGAYAHVGVLAGGIRQALITTASGLAIAIMATLAYHFLSSRVRAMIHEMEWAANDIMEFLGQGLPSREIVPPLSSTGATKTPVPSP